MYTIYIIASRHSKKKKLHRQSKLTHKYLIKLHWVPVNKYVPPLTQVFLEAKKIRSRSPMA